MIRQPASLLDSCPWNGIDAGDQHRPKQLAPVLGDFLRLYHPSGSEQKNRSGELFPGHAWDSEDSAAELFNHWFSLTHDASVASKAG